jgi:hypothetical protein
VVTAIRKIGGHRLTGNDVALIKRQGYAMAAKATFVLKGREMGSAD